MAVSRRPVSKRSPQKKTSIRNGVFVSYSRNDKQWLERVRVHLSPLESDHSVNVWIDTKLRGGDQWLIEIKKALAKAKVAVLLISADFLASKFISSNELPPLLLAAKKEGVTILPVLVGTCSFEHSSLNKFQSINTLDMPLKSLTDGQVDEVLNQLHNRIRDLLVEPQRRTAKASTIEISSKRLLPSKVGNLTIALERITKKPLKDKTERPKVLSKSSTSSAETIVLLVKQSGEWIVVPVSKAEVGESIQLLLRPRTISQRSFLADLQRSNSLNSLVFQKQAYHCNRPNLQMKMEGKLETWHITAIIQRPDYRTEVTFNGFTPDAQAQARARLLLLNELIPTTQTYYRVVSNNILANLDESPFLILYKQLGQQPTEFKKVAYLIAIWYLQMSNTVELVLKLDLRLKGSTLIINFEGKRNHQLHDSPSLLKVDGQLDLTKSPVSSTLGLVPLSRY